MVSGVLRLKRKKIIYNFREGGIFSDEIYSRLTSQRKILKVFFNYFVEFFVLETRYI